MTNSHGVLLSERRGVAVFRSSSGCVSSWGCVVSKDGQCHNCGDTLEAAPLSECCYAPVEVFSPRGPAQCSACGMSPTWPIGVHWPDNLRSVEWPADWEDDVFRGNGTVIPEVESYRWNGWRPVAVSPRQRRSETGDIVAQYILISD